MMAMHTWGEAQRLWGTGLSELLLNAKCVVLTKNLLRVLQPLFFAVAYVINNKTSESI